MLVLGLHHLLLLKMMQQVLQPLDVGHGHSTNLVGWKSLELVVGKRFCASLGGLSRLEIDEGIPDVFVVLEIDRQIQKIILVCKTHLIDLVHEHLLLVPVGDVPDHQGGLLLLLRGVLAVGGLKVRGARHLGVVVRKELLAAATALGRRRRGASPIALIPAVPTVTAITAIAHVPGAASAHAPLAWQGHVTQIGYPSDGRWGES
mmetsp:Transcript_51657/g.136501  ORF Transcript_51657/g.136501 Transcript_51657/m.136501 type:complete len:204 (+) Transcript_51657:223-834(+)